MRRQKLTWFFLLLTGLAPIRAAELTAGEILVNVAAAAARNKTIRGCVVAESGSQKSPRRYTIYYWRSGEDRFRMQMDDILVIRNGDTLWMKLGKDVTKSSVKAEGDPGMGQGGLLMQFLQGRVDPGAFAATLRGTEAVSGEEAFVLRLAARDNPKITSTVWVRKKDWVPVKSTAKGRAGVDETSYLKELVINEALDEGLFTYAGPAK